jgi:hypothetical protein
MGIEKMREQFSECLFIPAPTYLWQHDMMMP